MISQHMCINALCRRDSIVCAGGLHCLEILILENAIVFSGAYCAHIYIVSESHCVRTVFIGNSISSECNVYIIYIDLTIAYLTRPYVRLCPCTHYRVNVWVCACIRTHDNIHTQGFSCDQSLWLERKKISNEFRVIKCIKNKAIWCFAYTNIRMARVSLLGLFDVNV